MAKIKKLKTYVSAAVLLIMIVVGILGTQQAHAATAKCYQSLGGGSFGSSVFDCPASTPYKIDGGTFADNKCYRTIAFGSQIVWQKVDCTKPPFTAQANTTVDHFKTDCNDATLSTTNCGIVRYLQIFINALSGLVGIVIVIMMIIGGIEYSAAGNDPQRVSAARSKISNALLALLVFIFMYAFLQWVVPGGIF